MFKLHMVVLQRLHQSISFQEGMRVHFYNLMRSPWEIMKVTFCFYFSTHASVSLETS
jgi:hypothetical protein